MFILIHFSTLLHQINCMITIIHICKTLPALLFSDSQYLIEKNPSKSWKISGFPEMAKTIWARSLKQICILRPSINHRRFITFPTHITTNGVKLVGLLQQVNDVFSWLISCSYARYILHVLGSTSLPLCFLPSTLFLLHTHLLFLFCSFIIWIFF